MFPRNKRFLAGWLLLCLFGLTPTVQAADGLRVLVSIKPIHSIVAALMQDVEGPDLLIDDARTPYDYSLSPEQRSALGDYDLVIRVGPELEAFLSQAMAQLPPGTRAVDLLDHPRLKILPSRDGSGGRDPYFWLDNRNIIMLAEELVALLQELDPARTHVYTRNLRNLGLRLGQMDREYEYGYRGLKAAPAVQYHDTLQYFEQAYALNVLDRVGTSPQQPDDTHRLLGVRRHIVDGTTRCLLVEQSLPTPNLPLLTADTDVRVAQLDSLGSVLSPGPDLYFQLMQRNTDRIKGCLDPGGALANTHAEPPEGAPAGGSGERFLLTDTRGRLVSDADLRDGFHILYFGYTFCPDICPTSLAVLGSALNRLGDKAQQIQPWFITIDPQRDSLQVMRDYVAYFDKRLIGVTGNPVMIDRLAARFNAKYEKVVEEGRDPDLYVMDHSASLYLLGPDGRYITKFLHGISPEQLHAELLKHLH